MATQAEKYKSQGNNALQAKMFSEAVELYTKAIGLDPNCEVYFSNRAAAYAAQDRFREALDDANEAISLRPDWVKGHVRRAVALTGLKQYEEARKAYLKASQIEPANTQLLDSMRAVAELAKKEPEKNWENDLWSEEEEEEPQSATSSNAKRNAAEAGVDEASKKRKRANKPDEKLLQQLKRSLADSSEDTLRACLTQLSSVDAEVAQKTLHILEGLNAASSAGESEGEDGDAANGGWLDSNRSWHSRAGHGGASDSD
ncbi:hypothetical protein AB1Y20_002812 [Prymnesium parvum]|uniref:Stress-induced-phosphoprotein 1 n=1 Tax=Prymnesium parvum TaxID=97485 RepID=A0AB34JAL7_PRYPA